LQHHIPDKPFDTPISLSLSSAQKKHNNATLDVQKFFTKDGKIQQVLVYGLGDQIQTIFGLSNKHHNSFIMIFESIIGVALNYTRQGQVSPTSEELMETPNS
jgi:hypothetical protein